MVLAGVGDLLGYKCDAWEFQKSSIIIHKEFDEMTKGKGMINLKLGMKWKYSDDTVMHMATARGLLCKGAEKRDLQFYQKLAKEYKATIKLMAGRAPGKTCMK